MKHLFPCVAMFLTFYSNSQEFKPDLIIDTWKRCQLKSSRDSVVLYRMSVYDGASCQAKIEQNSLAHIWEYHIEFKPDGEVVYGGEVAMDKIIARKSTEIETKDNRGVDLTSNPRISDTSSLFYPDYRSVDTSSFMTFTEVGDSVPTGYLEYEIPPEYGSDPIKEITDKSKQNESGGQGNKSSYSLQGRILILKGEFEMKFKVIYLDNEKLVLVAI